MAQIGSALAFRRNIKCRARSPTDPAVLFSAAARFSSVLHLHVYIHMHSHIHIHMFMHVHIHIYLHVHIRTAIARVSNPTDPAVLFSAAAKFCTDTYIYTCTGKST